MSRRLAIIPARGGSRRLPRKNVLPFNGIPIIAHTIGAALETDLFARIVVSTEDSEIADVARRYGAEVDARPKRLATDAATIIEVCEELLGREAQAGRDYDILCCLYATAPLRNAEDIVRTVTLLDAEACDFSMAVTRYLHYPHQALRKMDGAFLTPMWPELADIRADALGQLVAGNGSTYCARVTEFLRLRSFYGPRLRGHEMPLSRSVDIDTEEDFQMALALSQYVLGRVSAAQT